MLAPTVTKRTVTRYFVYGKGYSSELAAYMQIARRHVSKLQHDEREKYRADHPGRDVARADWAKEFEEWVTTWWTTRYPKREDCLCSFCRGGRKLPGTFTERGCWQARLEDYRKIAREIMDGKRNPDGSEYSLPEVGEC